MSRAFSRALVFLPLALGLVPPLGGQDTHVLIVVGLGGDEAYRERFHGWAVEMVSLAEERFGLDPERIRYLGEGQPGDPEGLDGRSTLETIASEVQRMGNRAGARDRVLILLIGHGTGQGEEVELNLPGPDLTPGELARMLDWLPTQTVAVVNAASSSGPFLPPLSGPNRIIVTATRSAQERNETQFGRFFVEGLGSEAADLDKDGATSLEEAFRYARREVDRYYESRNLLATEHAQLDDDGDGEGVGEVNEDASDGRLAASFRFGPISRVGAENATLDSISDPELRRLYGERADLERRVRELRALRGQIEEARYERELEALLVELALKNREIREKGGTP